MTYSNLSAATPQKGAPAGFYKVYWFKNNRVAGSSDPHQSQFYLANYNVVKNVDFFVIVAVALGADVRTDFSVRWSDLPDNYAEKSTLRFGIDDMYLVSFQNTDSSKKQLYLKPDAGKWSILLSQCNSVSSSCFFPTSVDDSEYKYNFDAKKPIIELEGNHWAFVSILNNDGYNPSTNPQPVTFSGHFEFDHGLGGWAIFGIVMGSVVLVAAIGGGVWYWRKRRNQSSEFQSNYSSDLNN